MRYVLMACVMLVLAACESDAEKLDRLQHDQSMAMLDRLRWEQAIADSMAERGRVSTTLRDSLRHAVAAETRANNEMRRFLGY